MAKKTTQKSKDKKHQKTQRWVVKAGSQMVCDGGPLIIKSWMQQLSTLEDEFGIEIIWVTSGAIASAVDKLRFHRKNKLLCEKQALSAIGQPMVMDLYNLALHSVGKIGAQVLLTYDDMADFERRNNFQNTIEQLLSWRVTPVLNENDAVATQEIKFGDNDRLSAKVARYLKADRLVILTDVDGLYDSDPKMNSKAKLISEVNNLKKILTSDLKKSASSKKGTGGIYSKILAAQYASEHEIPTWLVRGDHAGVLIKVAKGEKIGTKIVPHKTRKG